MVDNSGMNPGQLILKVGFQHCFFFTLEPWFSISATHWTPVEMILESFAAVDTAMEKNKIVLLTTWMNLYNIMMKERNQTHKSIDWRNPFISSSKTGKTKQNSACHWGVGIDWKEAQGGLLGSYTYSISWPMWWLHGWVYVYSQNVWRQS